MFVDLRSRTFSFLHYFKFICFNDKQLDNINYYVSQNSSQSFFKSY